jgi:hypothetical protein
MVRHEAAEALGSIAADECEALLLVHVADPEPIVADSCVVALDMLEFERSGGFQYADTCASMGEPKQTDQAGTAGPESAQPLSGLCEERRPQYGCDNGVEPTVALLHVAVGGAAQPAGDEQAPVWHSPQRTTPVARDGVLA